MKIGKYELSYDYYTKDDEIWIRKNCGEGVIFKKEELFKLLEAVIDKFYEENF